MDYKIIATSAFGVEGITAKELKSLGYEDLKVENGKVEFEGDEMDIAIANIHLRTAERVFIKMAEFKATTFEELFQGTLLVDWWKLIPENGKMHVIGKSIKSTLHSVPDCQSIVKKAVVKSMQRKYNRETFKEDGPVYKIEVAILKDMVTLSVDTSGVGLHKRGYREHSGAAPLKETLAATIALLSNWRGEALLVDPFCGSGTLLIEAAMLANNIAPGLKRRFVSEEWPTMPSNVWAMVREGAENTIKNNPIKLVGYDIDTWVLRTARNNAIKAGVSEYIDFHPEDFKNFSSKKKGVTVITNPPYGERLGERREVEFLYKKLGELYKEQDTWNFNIITSFEQFQRYFGTNADKNRKLYNGKLKCYLYQYKNRR